jgi:hypothetical protein
MKTLALIFLCLSSVVGCSRHQSSSAAASRQIQQWVPDYASLVTVREIMEQHHFDCSVQSYTHSQEIPNNGDRDFFGRTYVIKGQAQVVTNVSYLECVSRATNSMDGWARFTFINQKYIRLWVSSSGRPH